MIEFRRPKIEKLYKNSKRSAYLVAPLPQEIVAGVRRLLNIISIELVKFIFVYVYGVDF